MKDRFCKILTKREFLHVSPINNKFQGLLYCSAEMVFVPKMNFEGTATWKGGTECALSVKGKNIATVSPPPAFGGKEATAFPKRSLQLHLLHA